MFLERFVTKEKILLYQNYFTLSFCCYFLFLYDIYDRHYMEIYGSFYILIYMILDLFLFPKTWEYILHHLLSIILALQDQYLSKTHQYQLLLFRTEYSTIFLNMYYITRQKIWLPVFVSLFIYFRIFMMSYFFIEKGLDIPIQEYPLLGLYILNIYWFHLIMNYMYKKLLMK